MLLIRTLRALIAATLVASVQLLSVASPAAAASVTCTYTASNQRVKATISGTGYVTLERDSRSRIKAAGIWCGNAATVYNTDQINVFAGDGNQQVTVLTKQNGGFQPGFTDEPGNSDEVEISISLGNGDSDTVAVQGGDASEHYVAGRSSGSFALLGRVNVNANEATGMDGDITLILGIEQLRLYGMSGGDTLSGDGGYGTGQSFNAPMYVSGSDGSDTLIGGAAADEVYGGAGPDTLKGGAGPDYLKAMDGIQGNDAVFGGAGVDICETDPGDQETSC
jgi:Ca2+-binding RTX toxin-like protein